MDFIGALAQRNRHNDRRGPGGGALRIRFRTRRLRRACCGGRRRAALQSGVQSFKYLLNHDLVRPIARGDRKVGQRVDRVALVDKGAQGFFGVL